MCDLLLICYQARCLTKISVSQTEKYEICALAILVFFKNEIPTFENTNSVNICIESEAPNKVYKKKNTW